jgi:hypothetical protein
MPIEPERIDTQECIDTNPAEDTGAFDPPAMSEEDWARLHDELDAIGPKTQRQREKLSERLSKLTAKELKELPVQRLLSLRAKDRALFEDAVAYWGDIIGRAKRAEAKAAWNAGKRETAKGSNRRFKSFSVEPGRITGLKPSHPAYKAGLTIFPSTVVSPWDTDRLLVSGKENAKLGGRIEKGPWAGRPLYHLTLEERATCPRSCQMWASCYGNAMHLARRHEAGHEDFLDFLKAELFLLARAHQDTGFVVRLHTLGDFYSVDYVKFWAGMLARLPMLSCFGYTHNHPDAEDERERAIGQAIALATETGEDWTRFAIRFSSRPGPQGAIVVRERADAGEAILCPSQREPGEEGATDSCATCGLCWAPAAREKTIAFLLHGKKARGAKAELPAAEGA